MKKFFRTAFIISFVIGLGLGSYVYWALYVPNTNNEAVEAVYIRTTDDFDAVYKQLLPLLKNPTGFEKIARVLKYKQAVKPGKYEIQPASNNMDLVALLRSGRQVPVMVTFNNLRNIQQLCGVVAQQLELDSVSCYQSFMDTEFLEAQNLNSETVSAIVLPNSYEFYWATTAQKFRDRMVVEHQKFWNATRHQKATQLNLNPVEVATLGAIVEKETTKRDEMPIVAGLYLNRLKKGMRLQSDPTVIYGIGHALGRDTVVRRVYYKHLEFPSPYNTYLNAGLPPAPITIPDGRTLDAVLDAARHNYIYMCADPDRPGYHSFAVNDQQHATNKKKYTNWLEKQRIYR